MLKLLWQILLVVVVAAPPILVAEAGAQARQSDRPANAVRYTFADGRISFVGPPGFTVLTAAELSAKYPNAGAPRNALGNTRRTTSIAYDLLDQRSPSADLDALRRALMGSFAQLPDLKWVASDVRRVGSRDWAYIEFTAAAADQPLHNIVLTSVYDGRVLMFNFNSTVAEFPRVEQALRASMATISSKP